MITTNTWLGAIFFILAAGFFCYLFTKTEYGSFAEAHVGCLAALCVICALFLAGYAIPLTLEGLK